MKRFGVFIAIFVICLTCGFLSACGDKEVELKLSTWIENNVSMQYDEVNSSKEGKLNKYTLEVKFGTFIDITKLEVQWIENQNQNIIQKKTDSTDGYIMVENTLPSNREEQTIGDYKVEISYKDWTNIISIKINKRDVKTPYLDGLTQEYEWTGSKITPDFVFEDSDYYNIVGQKEATNVGEYTLTFSLKDKENTYWQYNTDPTADWSINWYIVKRKLDITAFEEEIELKASLFVKYDGQPHMLDIENPFEPYTELYYKTQTGERVTAPIVDVGWYYLFIGIKEEYQNHFTLYWNFNDVGQERQIGTISIYAE